MLPSQSMRPSHSHAHMYRRGGRRSWFILAGGAFTIVLAVIAIKWMSGGGERASADSGAAGLQANAQPAAPKSAEPKPVKQQPLAVPTIAENKPRLEPKPSEPNKISMGSSIATSRPAADVLAKPPVAANAPKKDTPAPPDQAAAAPSPAVSAPPPAAKPPQTSNSPPSQRLQVGLDLIKQNKAVEARKVLSEALNTTSLSTAEADRIRSELTKLNERLVFSPEVAADDPYASTHVIGDGEYLSTVPKKLGLNVDWRFLQDINRIDPKRIRAGQRIKVMKGPFHAIIDKRAFRLDLYMGDFSDRVFVRSFPVGLGEFGATPEGVFAVKPGSKLVNPAWTNPRTGEQFKADDPKNPLGEYWVGLIGASDNIRGLETYGIHGTIEPDSIGLEKSMGCVRMLDDDIRIVYEVLMEQVSRVEIHGTDWP